MKLHHRFIRSLVAEAPAGGSQEDPGVETPPADQGEEKSPAPSPDGDQEGEDEDEEGGAWDPKRALAKIAKVNREAQAQRERAKTAEARAKEAEDKLTPAQQRIAALEAENLRIRLAHEWGLPDELADRLQGSTKEELAEDAARLMQVLTAAQPTKPGGVVFGGPPKQPSDEAIYKMVAQSL